MVPPRTLIPVVLLALLHAPADAADVRLTLADGSVVVAEIQSVRGGTYTLTSPALGTISVQESNIRRIEMPAGAPLPIGHAVAVPELGGTTNVPAGSAPATIEPGTPSASANAPSPPQIDALQRRILGDEAVMRSVVALQGDPQFQAVLQDPEIAGAIRSGDLNALARNPRFRGLLADPTVQDITDQLAR